MSNNTYLKMEGVIDFNHKYSTYTRDLKSKNIIIERCNQPREKNTQRGFV